MRAAIAFTLAALPCVAQSTQRFVTGHQMLAIPRYGASTSVNQMREEVRQWKDMGLDAVMLFDIGGLTGDGPKLASNGLKYHEAGVAEGFKFAMSMTHMPANEVSRYVDYVKSLADPKYAAARFFVDGRPYLSSYHGSGWYPQVVGALAAQGYPVYFEPMVFCRGFNGDPNSLAWESGYITSTTRATLDTLMKHPTWSGAQGFAEFEIGRSLQDQATHIDWLWETAQANNKTARASIVPYYKGYAHKGNWQAYESWGYARLQIGLHRAVHSGVPAIEFITLNDFSESSYMNSWGENDPVILTNHWNILDGPALLDHSGFRYFSKRYIQWFKTGVEPAIVEDELYYAYRLHPRDASNYQALSAAEKSALQHWIPTNQPADWLYRKDGLPSSFSGWGGHHSTGIDWSKFSDGIHVAVRLTSPADVYINGVKVGSNLPAGEHLLVKPGERSDGAGSLGYPMHTFGPSDYGFPRFEIRRGTQTVLQHTGELEITAYAVPGCWNIFARKAPAPTGSAGALGVALASPANSATFNAGATVPLAVALAGDTSRLTRVEYFRGSTKITETTSAPWTASWTNAASGTHAITARATEDTGAVTTSAGSTIFVGAPVQTSARTPHLGIRTGIPGRIETEAYDVGGQNVAYHDTTVGNTPGAFRSDDVDLEPNSGGHHLSFFSGSEWILYSVRVDKTARYRGSVRVASQGQGGTFRLELDGQNISGTLTIPNTGGWSAWQTLTFEADLAEGDRDLRLVGIANGPGGQYIGNIDWFEFAEVTPPAPAPIVAPTPTLTAPSAGATFTAGQSITLTASLAGDASTLARVEFFTGANKLGERTASPWSISWTPTAGAHTLTARASTTSGATATSAGVAITVSAPPAAAQRAPHGGARQTIPGVVEVERYDTGGANVAYSDTTAGNLGGAFRADDVDLEADGDGHVLAYFAATEWLLYSVTATRTARHVIAARVASNGPGGTFRLELDGEPVGATLTIPSTGGWDVYQWVVTEADIPAGDHDLRLVGVANGPGSAHIGNIDRIEFTEKTDAPAPVPTLTAPTAGANFASGTPITVAAGFAGDASQVTRVEFHAGLLKIGERNAPPWSISWSGAIAGPHSLTARSTIAGGATATSPPVAITVLAPGASPRTPHLGVRTTVPGRIEAEHYDEGGPGIAYSDKTPANDGGAYRTDGVDIEGNEAGRHVSHFEAGEWMLYSIHVERAGRYEGRVRLASPESGGSLRIEIGGADVSGPMLVPATGGWGAWRELIFEAQLAQGAHDLRLVGLQNPGGVAGAFIANLDWIQLTELTGSSPAPQPTLTSPGPGAIFEKGAPVFVAAALAGDTTGLDRVEFYAGAARVAQRTAPPWNFTWADPPAGAHVLTARTRTVDGRTAVSAPVSVVVRAAAPVPTIHLPPDGATPIAGEPLLVAASIAGDASDLARLEFFLGATRIGERTGAPFTILWTGSAVGTFALTARATTHAGATATSAPVTITLQARTPGGIIAPGATVSARDFGARGDGVADDTAALREAIATIGAIGGTLHIPAGTYRIAPQTAGGEALAIDFDDLVIRGDGADRTVLSLVPRGGGDPATSWDVVSGEVRRGTAIRINGSTSAASPRRGVAIKDLRITGNTPATGSLARPANPATGDGWDETHHAIAITPGTHIDGVRLERLELDRFRGEIVHAPGATNGLLEINNCRIHGSNAVGVSVAADLRLTNSDIHDHAFAAVVATHGNRASGPAQHGYYFNNILEPRRTLATNGLHALVLRGEGDAATDPSLAPTGLVIAIQRNLFRNGLHHGILADAGLHDAILEDNDFVNNGGSGNPRHGHLALAPAQGGVAGARVEGVVVRGNRFTITGASASGHAVFLNSAGRAIRDVEIDGNTLENPVGSAYFIRRFLLLESAVGADVAGLRFTRNGANAVSAAVEDLSRTTRRSTRPLYADNTVNVTSFTSGEDDFFIPAGGAEIAPSWSRARIVVAADRAPVRIREHLALYPDGTTITLHAAPGPAGFLLQPDPTWNRFTAERPVAGGASIVLRKRAGLFEVHETAPPAVGPIAPPAPPAPAALAITLVDPVAGASFSSGGSIRLAAAIEGDASRIARVEFLVDGAVVGERRSAPFELAWTPPGAGPRLVSARLTGTAGETAKSARVPIRVLAPAASGARHDPLRTLDIGETLFPGTTTHDEIAGAHRVEAAGADLWGRSDRFHFAHQSFEGDGEIAVRVASLLATDPWTKAGLMVRGSTHAEAAYAAILLTPSNGVVFQHRPLHGAETAAHNVPSFAAPAWLKLRREGAVVIGSVSWEGELWTEVARHSVELPHLARGGLAVTSRNPAVTTTAVFTGLAITRLPEIYASIEVGPTGVAGFSVHNDVTDARTIGGAGGDVWGRVDAFRFDHRAVIGDHTLMARVEAFDAAHPWAKAGLMLRDGIEAGAANVALFVTPRNGVILQSRSAAGAITTSVVRGGLGAPLHLALERRGDRVHGFVSVDRLVWEPVGSVAVTLPPTLQAGLAVTSRDPSTLATARFTGVGLVQ